MERIQKFIESLYTSEDYPVSIISNIKPLSDRIDIVNYLKTHTIDETEEFFNIILISIYFEHFGQNIMGYIEKI